MDAEGAEPAIRLVEQRAAGIEQRAEVMGGEAAREAEEAVVTLQRLFSEERLSLKTMDLPLRAVVLFAIATLVGVAALMGDSRLGGRGVDVGIARVHPFVPITMATPVFAASVSLAVIGLAYVLAGASLIELPLAFLLVWALDALTSLYLGAFGALVGQPGPLAIVDPWARWTGRALLVAIALVPLATRLLPGSWRLEQRRRNVVLGLYIVLLGGVVGVCWGAAAIKGPSGTGIFGLTMSILFGTLFLPMIPLLVVAATDFSEWGEVVGTHAFMAISSRRPALLPALATGLALGVVVLGWSSLEGSHPFLSLAALEPAGGSILACAGALALLVGAFIALRLHRRRLPRRIRFAPLVLACAGVLVGVPPLASWLARTSAPAPPLASARGAYRPGAAVTRIREVVPGTGDTFSLQVPTSWTAARGSSAVALTGSSGAASELVFVAVGPKASAATYATSEHLRPTRRLHLGRWSGVQVLDHAARGSRAGYVLTAPGPAGNRVVYVLQEIVAVPDQSAGAALSAERPVFLAVAGTFRGAGERPAPLPARPSPPGTSRADRQVGIEVGLDLAFAGLLLAAGLGRRRQKRELVTSGLLVAAFTLFFALPNASALGHLTFGATTRIPSLGVGGLLVAVGFGGLAVVATAVLRLGDRSSLTRRVLGAVAGLEAATATLEGMNVLYQKAESMSEVGVVAAVVLLVGIAWDVIFSGSTTNKSGATAPRSARVLLYFGYVVLLNGSLLYAAHAVVSGSSSASFLPLLSSPDSLTHDALFAVALPALLVTFLLRLAGPSEAQAAER